MNRIKKTIKGLFLTALIVGAFGLNLSAQWPDNTTQSLNISTYAESFITPNVLAAQGDTTATDTTTEESEGSEDKAKPEYKISEKLKEAILGASDLVNKVFDPAIFTITHNIGGLLGNDYIFAGKMGEMLHGIWVVSRNIVNILFVLILLFLALRHIFGSEESSELKKILPKFIIMLIAINFSWLGSRLILDAANVTTNIAFAIPSGARGVIDISEDSEKEKEEKKCRVEGAKENGLGGSGVKGDCAIAQVYKPFDAVEDQHMMESDCGGEIMESNYNLTYTGGPVNKDSPFYQTSTYCWKQMEIDKFSRNNAAYHLTYSMAKVQNLPKASAAGANAETFAKIGIGTLFSLFFQIVYLVAFASLFIALIFRVAALWFMVAFSPFIVLLLYLSQDTQLSKIGGGISEKVGIGAFIDWAFAPAKVAAVWAIGFLMINTGQTASDKLSVTLNSQAEITSYGFNVSSFYMGMESLQEIMWLLMTIGIIWIGTFAVLSKLSIVGGMMGKIENYGTDLAKEVAMSPRWAPIMPKIDPVSGKMTLGSYGKTAGPLGKLRSMRDKYTGRNDEKFEKAYEKLKTAKDRNSSDFARISNGNDKESFKAFSRISGLTASEINKDPDKVRAMLKDLEVKDHENVANSIIKGASKGTGGLSSPADSRVTKQPLTQAQTTKAFQKALASERVRKRMGELKHQEVLDKAHKIREKTPSISHEDALIQAADALNEAAGTPAAGAGTGATPPPPPSTTPATPTEPTPPEDGATP